MPKPKSKSELLSASQANYARLLALINGYSSEQIEQSFPEGTMNRNIRDVLAHIHHWHLMFQEWYRIGMNGEKPAMPAEGYTWKSLPDLNKKIWADYQTVSLAAVQQQLEASYTALQQLIQAHDDDELFEKKRYAWTGSTSLGAYLISNTSSHYDWAYKQIKKGMKNVK